MIAYDRFIESHRETSLCADRVASLALAANLVMDGGALNCPKQRSSIALDLLEVIRLLSTDLSRKTVDLSDNAEREEMESRRKPN